MHQSFETSGPTPRARPGNAGTFTSYSLHFRTLVDGEYTRNHGLRLPDRGISGAVTPWSAVFIFMPHSNFAYIIITPLIERSKRIAKRSDTKLQVKMLCETSFCLSGLKKALVAEDFLSLVRKGGHIFNDILYFVTSRCKIERWCWNSRLFLSIEGFQVLLQLLPNQRFHFTATLFFLYKNLF